MIKESEIHQQIEKARAVLAKHRAIVYAFLFGSILKRPRPDSDVDILVNGGLTFKQQVDLSLNLEKIFRRRVDIVPVDMTSNEVVMEALSRGKALVIKNKAQFKNIYFRNLYQYEDALPLREIKRLHIKEKFCG